MIKDNLQLNNELIFRKERFQRDQPQTKRQDATRNEADGTSDGVNRQPYGAYTSDHPNMKSFVKRVVLPILGERPPNLGRRFVTQALVVSS